MSVARYRKQPIEVDTIQWTGTNELEVQEFTGGAHRFHALDPEDRENSDDPEATATVYDRLHSTWVLVYTGQHIVRGVKGEFYPIAEDVLAETYELVTGTTVPADEQAYDGELAMLRGLVRTLRAVVRDDRADVAQKEVRRLLYEHTADERAAYEQKSNRPADAAPSFFQPGHTYAKGQDGYKAPEQTWQFRCVAVAEHPREGAGRRAFGFMRQGIGPWDSSGVREGEFERGWTDITEAGEGS